MNNIVRLMSGQNFSTTTSSPVLSRSRRYLLPTRTDSSTRTGNRDTAGHRTQVMNERLMLGLKLQIAPWLPP